MGDKRYHCTLADACKAINYGLTASASSHPIGPRFLRITDIVPGFVDWNTVPYVAADNDLSTKYALDDGDIVIARTGASTGASAYVKSPPSAIFASYLVRLKVKPEFDARYVSYFLKSPMFLEYIRGVLGDKSAQPNASASTMTSAPISAPRDKVVQRAIAYILGTLDDKIDLNRRMNETLEAMARALFKDWFVDFGPVRAKAEGRAPYLAPEIWRLFPDSLEGEEQPAGWEPSELGDRTEVLDSTRIPLSSRERQKRQGPYPYHGAAGVMDYVDDYLFDGVHILLGEDGSVVKPTGKPVTQYVWGKFWVNNHAHVLQGKSISNEMLLCFLEQVDIAPYVTGAVQPKLNQKNLKSVPFPPAESKIVACFGAVIEPLFEQLRFYTEQSCTLRLTRNLLLPKLISGEIHLSDAENIVEAVA